MASSFIPSIPTDLPGVAGWKSHPVKDNGEKLVPLGAFTKYSSKKIVTEGIYFGETVNSPYHHGELEGALITPFVREGLAETLAKASELLPDNMYLLVLDAYRPLSVQQALYDDFYQQLLNKGMNAEEASAEAQKFVSIPSKDPSKPSPHNTGGSVDLTIIKVDDETAKKIQRIDKIIEYCGDREDKWKTVYKMEVLKMALLRSHGEELQMGTAFDEVCPATETSFFETKNMLSPTEAECKKNRQLLFDVMTKAGATNYKEEWWHFDKGNQFNGIVTGEEAVYSTANFDEECQKHEQMMQSHYKGVLALMESNHTAEEPLAQFVQQACRIVKIELKDSALATKGMRLTA